jgi:hypothetical protein
LNSELLIKLIFEKASQLHIPTVIIGGLALPAYNVARATLDIDISIYISTQKQLNQLLIDLKREGINTLEQPKLGQDLFIIFGFKNEVEIWLKPCDAFEWDKEMINRIKIFSGNTHVLALEDFILTKLARADRSSTDISDILQLLINNYDEIDWKYFRFRLNWASVEKDFKEILRGSELDLNVELKKILKEILERINQK